jgi:transcriptional regulator with GAF, ATPase, and Fis domain
MDISCWVYSFTQDSRHRQDALAETLAQHGIILEQLTQDGPSVPGVCICSEVTPELCTFLRNVSRAGRERILVLVDSMGAQNGVSGWALLQAGASDVLTWSDPAELAQQVRARFKRWLTVDQLLETPLVANSVVGKSPAWRAILRDIVEIARFSDAPALILGESGTGKELIARLLHTLDTRTHKRDLVVLDCSTIMPELSGSEFFGHERGAFTGAVSQRDGAFALADGGTLFLDEIGELPLSLQAQLLRVVQEHTYKRVGGNTWHRTDFRLVCATNRDLLAQVHLGEFRADLYYRIASFVCKLPSLRERLDDVIPLAEYFLRQMYPHGEPPQLDDAVRTYLLRREYPGNVRDLRQVVSRLLSRYAGGGTITIGSVPSEERPAAWQEKAVWLDVDFEGVIRRAVLCSARLKEIGRAAEDVAIRIATDQESGNLQRAARRLGVTDLTLQLRYANRRHMEEN